MESLSLEVIIKLIDNLGVVGVLLLIAGGLYRLLKDKENSERLMESIARNIESSNAINERMVEIYNLAIREELDSLDTAVSETLSLVRHCQEHKKNMSEGIEKELAKLNTTLEKINERAQAMSVATRAQSWSSINDGLKAMEARIDKLNDKLTDLFRLVRKVQA